MTLGDESSTPQVTAADVPAHLRGSISPEEWERICRDPDRAEDVRISRWVASLRGTES